MATLATACGRDDVQTPVDSAPRGVLSPEWIYAPASAETERSTGAVVIEAQVSAAGPVRRIAATRGQRLNAVLAGPAPADPALLVALGQSPVPPMLYAVTDGNLCDAGQATHIVWAEPELIEGRTLALAVLNGAPGETGSTVCRVLRYTRSRSLGAAEATEGAR
jgi:hypothetical protein